MQALPVEDRAALSRILTDGRALAGLSQERLAELAMERTRTRGEEVEVTRHHIANLENCPSHPLLDQERRIRLRAIADVLDVDRAKVNRLAGGI